MNDVKILDLGCGERKLPGAVGLDQVSLPGVDIVHNLEIFPYPLSDNSMDGIQMRHVMEHVSDVVALMREIHRISKSGARVKIFTPHFTSVNSYFDPTHRHHFGLATFDFFCGRSEHNYVAGVRFKLISRKVEMWPLHDKLKFRPYHFLGIKWLAENHPAFYERFLTFLFPIKEIQVELEVVK